MDLLGNDGKMTSENKFIGCFIKSPWYLVSNSWIQFMLTCFKRLQWFFTSYKLSMEIRIMTALLGNNGKVTSEYKLIGCLIKIPWYVVSDSSVHIIYILTFLLDKNYWITAFLFTWLLRANTMFFKYVSKYESVSRTCTPEKILQDTIWCQWIK